MIHAVIPVRSGSVRVKNKNIKRFANSSLLEIKINQLKRISCIEKITVNTDCEKMIKIAKEMNVSYFKRQKKYSNCKSKINDVWQNIAKNTEGDIILYTNVTNPLIEDRSYFESIDIFLKNNYDSVNSVTSIKEFLWMNNKPLNYSPEEQPRSQDLPEVFHPNFAINIIEKDYMFKNKTIIGKNFFPYVVNKIEAIDIDTEEDFKIAEILFKEIRNENTNK